MRILAFLENQTKFSVKTEQLRSDRCHFPIFYATALSVILDERLQRKEKLKKKLRVAPAQIIKTPMPDSKKNLQRR